MRENKAGVWLGLIAMVGLIAPFSNAANAIETKTLIKTTQESEPALKGAFLVSKVDKLEKYENAHKLTDWQLVELLNAVGFKGKALRSACAIAKAESNGRPMAYNATGKLETVHMECLK